MEEITKENLITTSKFHITSADTDMEARIRLGSLVNLLIQSAINSADNLEFGFRGIQQQKLFWVLSRLTIEIYRPLMWYSEVEVETWPKDIEKLLYLRDYIIRDNKQNIVAKATSGWLAIDRETKKPKKINGIHAYFFNHLKDKYAVKEPPEKLNSVEKGDQFEVNLTYYDIDLNRHVTATRYIDWIMDTFAFDFHTNNYPKRLSVNYMKETMPGEKIRFLRHQKDENRFFFEGTNLNSNTIACRARIDF